MGQFAIGSVPARGPTPRSTMPGVSSKASGVVVVAGALTQPHWVPPAELRARLARTAALADLRAPAIDLAWQDEALPRELAHDRWMRQQLAPTLSLAPIAPGAMTAVRQLAVLSSVGADAQGWLLEPTHFHLARDHLVLLAGAAQGLAQPQAQALAEAIEPLLAGDGMALTLASPTHWLLRQSERPWQLDCASADAAAGRNVDGYLPGGVDARRYRRLLNEIQMTWHDHPVNEQRTVAGELPINSVWLSGPVEASAIAAFREEVAGGRYRLEESLLGPRLRDDRHAWLDALQALDAQLHQWLTASPSTVILLCGDHDVRRLERGAAGGARRSRGTIAGGIDALLRRLRPTGTVAGRDAGPRAPADGAPIADPLARLFTEGPDPKMKANPA